MGKFTIKVYQDFESAENYLGHGIPFKIYRGVVNGVFKALILNLGANRLKDYSPVVDKENNSAIFTEESQDQVFLENERKKLEAFIFGDFKAFKELSQVKKAFSNRWVMKVYNKTYEYVEDQLRGTVLMFLSSMSIKIELEIF